MTTITCYTCGKDITKEVSNGKATLLSFNTMEYDCADCQNGSTVKKGG